MERFIEEVIKEVNISNALFQRQQEIQEQTELLESLTSLIMQSLTSTSEVKKQEIDLRKED